MRICAPRPWEGHDIDRPATPRNIAGLIALVLLLRLLWVPSAAAASQPTDAEDLLLSGTRQLTFEGRRSGEGYFNADATRMIFQSERDPANPFYRIYLMDLENGDVEAVSPAHGKSSCAWIHPDDRRVLYASTHDDPQARAKMKAEFDFRGSGKERRYSWDYDPKFEIYDQDLDSGRRRNLTTAPGYDAEGAYSPDGGKIVFASNRRAYQGGMSAEEKKIFEHDKSFMMDIYLMNADGSQVQRLTDSPGYDGGPFFSFDGRKIAWRRFSVDGSRAEIFTMDLATRSETQLTHMGVMSWAPFFHPSGEYLIFASNRQGFANFELYLVDADGTRDPVRVTYTDGFDGLPVFLPDGRRLAWTSNRAADGGSQLFIADWDHAEARRLLGLDEAGWPAVDGTRAGDRTRSAIVENDLRFHVGLLASDAMEGRMTGSDGAGRAGDYIAQAFKQFGLRPAGDDGTWFQSFRFTAGARPGSGNRLSVEGGADGAGLSLGTDWVPLALSRNGRVDATGVVFAGYGIVSPSADKVPAYDAYADLDVDGKWVMLLRHQPDAVPPEWRRHLLHYSDLAYKASVARQRGALGIIVVSGTPGVTGGSGLLAMKADANSATTSIAGISISDALASRLLSRAGHDLAALQAALDKGEHRRGFALGGVRVGADIDVERVQRQGRNVVGRLVASDGELPPLVIGAHIDHLGRGDSSGSLAKADERGRIHPGADDNASGVAAMLEVAQYLASLHEQRELGATRDILFAAWSGEELGMLGSSHFVDDRAGRDGLRVSAYLNMDMVGHLRDRLYLQGTGSSSVWAREIERRNVPVGLSIATMSDPYLPTDVTPFYVGGVPVLNAFTGAHEDYATPRDTPDRLNYEGIRDITRLMAGIGRSLARREDEPDYVEVSRKHSGISRKHLRAYLGTIPAYGQDESIKGVKLQGAVKHAPAEKAGIMDGDILVGLGGVEVETIHDFMGALSGLKVGEETGITVIRNGQRIELRVTPGSRD